ncbi:TIGR04255 family protein [Kribbella sp. C-35]|uniref:TIGR04255 family protein n=1 Tax=Kribbella sp. C-35 TaxID=2789276 RepID=UPI00397B1E2E
MYPNREVFRNAPLALVAAEIRFTDAARLRQQVTKDEVAIALEERFPFAEPLQRGEVTLNLGLGGAPPQIQERQGVVLKNASSTETLTVMSESLTYETTAYRSFNELLDVVRSACDALVAAKVRPAVQRVGLRYIDEVRVPETISDVRQWGTWINSRLIGQLEVGPDDYPATAMQSVTTFDLGGGRGLNFRCAALNQGPIVVPQFLRRPPIQSGPFFVLDFDGFHDFTGQEAVPLSSEVVCDSLSAVHLPCGTAFQRSITDEARTLFRGGPS